MLLNLLSRSTPGGVRVTIKASHVCFILILFTEFQLNFVESRRAKSKTNMLLNLLSQSTPGGRRSDAQSTHVCFILILFTERRHVRRDTQVLTGELTQYHRLIIENMSNHSDKPGTCIYEEHYSTQNNMSFLKLQLVQKHIENVYARSLSPIDDA